MTSMSFRLRKCNLTSIFLFLIVLTTTISCQNDTQEIMALTGPRSKQEDRANGVTFVYSQNGNVKMKVFANHFVRNSAAKRPYINMNKGLKMEFFDDSGNISDVLTADSSVYYETQRDFIVWDSVQILSKKGERLNTDELVWNELAQKFFTEKPVVITTPNEILYGEGMEANRDFTWYKILKPTGSVQVSKGEMPQ